MKYGFIGVGALFERTPNSTTSTCRVLAPLDAKNPRFLAYCDDLKLHMIVFTSLQSRYIIIDDIKGLKGICMQIRYGNLEMSATLEFFFFYLGPPPYQPG